jgi:hypothetical protein
MNEFILMYFLHMEWDDIKQLTLVERRWLAERVRAHR